jgi:hypothetical protein
VQSRVKGVGCIIHGSAAATTHAVVGRLERRYARARRSLDMKREHVAARQHADRQEGQTTTAIRTPASARQKRQRGQHADNPAATSSLRALSPVMRRAEKRGDTDAPSRTSALGHAARDARQIRVQGPLRAV